MARTRRTPARFADAFADLVSGPPTGWELDRAAALLAASFTGVDRTDEVIGRLDAMARRCADATLQGVFDVMRPHLTGDRTSYHDRRNSFIDAVLDRGVGLPITLSIIAIEIGRRVGAAIAGVGLPGHFVVRDLRADLYGDAFRDATVLDRPGLELAWPRLVPGRPFDELHLVPVSERLILLRMTNNLLGLPDVRSDPVAMYSLAVMRSGFAELAHEAAEHGRWVRAYN